MEKQETSEMVERVASALRFYTKPDAACLHGLTEGDARIFARAVIAAMREPTDAMVKQGHAGYGTGCWMGDAWRAMIDEALR